MAKRTNPPSKLKAVKKPVFDPQKTYNWNREDKIEISGAELETINNALNAYLADPATQKVLALIEGAKSLTAIIKREVENNGVIKEAVQTS